MRGPSLAIAPALALAGCSLLDDEPYAVPDGPHHTFVASRLELPATSARALELAFDIGDGDLQADNMVGDALSRLSSLLRISPTALADLAIAHGDAIALLSLRGPALDGGPLELYTFEGTEPFPEACTSPDDPVCARHLDGNGRFLRGGRGTSRPLVGENDRGTYYGVDGDVVLPLPLPGGGWLGLRDARVELRDVGPAGFHGRIGGVVAQPDLDLVLWPALGTLARAQLAASCPGGGAPDCGCTPGSDGENARDLFDQRPADCAISDAEVRAELQAFFVPDVTIAGDPPLPGFTYFVGITAVPADFFIP